MAPVKEEEKNGGMVTSSAELRTSLFSLGDTLREMREKDPTTRSEAWAREMRDVAHEVTGLDAELRIAELRERDEAAEKRAAGRQGAGPEGTGANFEDRETRSLGRQVVESEKFAGWRKSNSQGAGTSPDIEVRTIISEGAYLDPNGSAGLWVARGTPYLPPGAIDHRRLFVRDIIAGGNTTLSAIPYIRENNPRVYEEGATTVAEGATKAEVAMLFTQDVAIVRKIAAWVPVTTEILEDAPTLQSYINARLGYMLEVREEQQILNGTGLGSDLLGIVNFPNVQAQASIAGDFAATMGKSIGLIENVDGDADGIAMNPLDYWTMVTTRHAEWLDGSPVSAAPGLPFGPAPTTIWGLPTVRSRSVSQGEAIVGSWKTGAQLFDRSHAVVRVGDQHADYFTNNKVAILIEERIALAVYRPDWFVVASLS
jgi:hypothetical protein